MVNKNFAYWTLMLAGIYNILWGSWVIFFPALSFEILGATPPKYLEIWQCVGMIVGVYGLGYIVAAYHPYKHWPIVLVGFLGKIFGPIGFLKALIDGVFPLSFGINLIFNDLIWWIPFFLILKKALLRPGKEFVTIPKSEIEKMDKRKRVNFVNSLPGPRSVNLIGTKSQDGLTNLAVINSVLHLGADPALIGYISRPDSVERHTLQNIRETGFFTINQVSTTFFEKAHQTSARYSQSDSEFDATGLEAQYEKDFVAPYVGNSLIKIGVKYIRDQLIEENGTHLVIGEITNVILPKSLILDDGHIESHSTSPTVVVGLSEYLSVDTIGRLNYAKPDRKIEFS